MKDFHPLGHLPSRDLSRRDLLRLGAAGLGAFAAGSLIPASAGGLSLPGADGPAFVGAVREVIGDRPIAGAVVRVEPDGPATTTDPTGYFQLAVAPGSYTLTAEAAGYERHSFADYQLGSTLDRTVSFQLNRIGVPAGVLPLAIMSGIRLLDATALVLPQTIQLCSYPSTSGGVWLSLEDYVKGVVAPEMGTGWPMEALKAQAVAARTKGALAQIGQGYIWNTTQAYNPASALRGADTDAAVDSTRGVVLTYQGSLVDALYFGRCNGQSTRDSEHAISWSTCAELHWNYVAYLRARGCSGHSAYGGGSCGYYGHGVGMCQTGAGDFARQGRGYQDILRSYYTGIDFFGLPATPTPTPLPPSPTPTPSGPGTPVQRLPGNGSLFLPGETVSLAWSADRGVKYDLTLAQSADLTQGQVTYTGLTANSYAIAAGAVSATPYYWQVRAYDSLGRSVASPVWYYRVVSQRFRDYMPIVAR